MVNLNKLERLSARINALIKKEAETKLKRLTLNDPFEKINPAFYPVWICKKNHILLYGGRSSTKSSVISQKLVEKKMEHPMSNMVCMRKVASTLELSVYSQIKWALYDAGVADQFHFTKSPMRILHKKWGTGFYFAGADDPDKLKSLKIPLGYVTDVWIEEMDAFNGVEELDKIEDTFIRADLPDDLEVTVWQSWNTHRDPYHWTNVYKDSKLNDPDYYVHKSTYLDDVRGYNSQQLIRKIERYKENDPEYYRYMYLGEAIGLGDTVYNINLFKKLDEVPDNDPILELYYTIDGGHAESATTNLCLGLTAKRNIILLDTYYYSPSGKKQKKAPSQLAKSLNRFIQRTSKDERWVRTSSIVNRTIDSAEAAIRNQYALDYGIDLHPVAKKKKVTMIDYVRDLLAQGRFFYLDTENNQIFIKEHCEYAWDPKTIDSGDPKPIKKNDHCVDGFMYACVDNAREWELEI